MKRNSTKQITKAGYFVIDGLKLMDRTPVTDEKREAVETTMVALDSATDRLADLKRRKAEARQRLHRQRSTVRQAALGGAAVLALTNPALAADLPIAKVHAKMDPLLAGEAVVKVADRASSAPAKTIGDVVRRQLEDALATKQELDRLEAEATAAQSEIFGASFAFDNALRAGEYHIRRTAPEGSAALRHVKGRYMPRTQGAKGKRAKKADNASATPAEQEGKTGEPGPAAEKHVIAPLEQAVTAGEEQKNKAA